MPQFPITKYDLTHTHLYSTTKLGRKKKIKEVAWITLNIYSWSYLF